MSAFGKLAGAVAGGFGDAEKEVDRRRLARLQQAQLLASLSEQGYGMGEAPEDPGVEMLSGHGVDDAVSAATGGVSLGQQAAKRKRYETVAPGKHGLYRDVTRTPEARRQRAEEVVAQRQEERDRRTLERQTALEEIKAKNQRKPQQHVVDPVTGKVSFFDPENPPADLSVHPQPRDAYSFPVVTGEDGKQVVARANTRTGTIEPTTIAAPERSAGGARMGAAKIRQAITANRTQMAIIDEAIKELDAYHNAVGLNRGAGLIPGMGEAAGQINQRADPRGEKARNKIQNVTSITILDRSGKAVTKTEMAMLGFLPNVASTYEANRQKLLDLKHFAETETGFLEQGSKSAPAAGGASREQALWDAAVAKHGKDKVLAEVGPRPQEEE